VQAGRPTVSLGFTFDQRKNGRGRLTVRRQTVGRTTTELRYTRDAQGRLFEMHY
jgi:YD repeat-containing protein